MKLKKNDYSLMIVDDAQSRKCVQNIRPMSNILQSICDFEEQATLETFNYLFGSTGEILFDSFIDFSGLYYLLNPQHKSKLAAYIEAITPNYEVEKMVLKTDLKFILKADINQVQNVVRYINHERYSGTLDENLILKWYKKNIKTIK